MWTRYTDIAVVASRPYRLCLLVVAALSAGCAGIGGGVEGGQGQQDRGQSPDSDPTVESAVVEGGRSPDSDPTVDPTEPTDRGQSLDSDPKRLADPEVDVEAAVRFRAGVRAMQEQRYDEARKFFDAVIDMQPELAGPWLNIARLELLAFDLDAAKVAYERVLELKTHDCHASNGLGIIARKRGLFRYAEEHYRQCAPADGGYAHAQMNLGILYEVYLGRLQEALMAYERYLEAAAEPDPQVERWVADIQRRFGG